MERKDLIKTVLSNFNNRNGASIFIEVSHYPNFLLGKSFSNTKSFKEFLFQNVDINTEYIFLNYSDSKVVFRFHDESYTFQKNENDWKLESFINFKKDLEYISSSIDLSGLLFDLKKIAS